MLLGDTGFLKGFQIFKKGKVRDVYDLGDRLLIIVTDRISAFDVVFPTLIPHKGRILNRISEFWFDYTDNIIGNHMITADTDGYPDSLKQYDAEISGRSMIVRKVRMLEAECIVRGYLEGSGFREYKETGAICGIRLPKGMKQAEKLPEPVFTPSTKASGGHDVNISFADYENMVGSETARYTRDKSIELYVSACRYAEKKGMILADTKYEFGIGDNGIIVADEMFTPDSSRFWDISLYEPGKAQESFDKQYLREYLEKTGWDKTPPAPELPAEVVDKTVGKYIEAYERIVGKPFEK